MTVLSVEMTVLFAGMTVLFAGMTVLFAGMTVLFAGMTGVRGGIDACLFCERQMFYGKYQSKNIGKRLSRVGGNPWFVGPQMPTLVRMKSFKSVPLS